MWFCFWCIGHNSWGSWNNSPVHLEASDGREGKFLHRGDSTFFVDSRIHVQICCSPQLFILSRAFSFSGDSKQRWYCKGVSNLSSLFSFWSRGCNKSPIGNYAAASHKYNGSRLFTKKPTLYCFCLEKRILICSWLGRTDIVILIIISCPTFPVLSRHALLHWNDLLRLLCRLHVHYRNLWSVWFIGYIPVGYIR